ncbi:hypothetical protein [Streptomyces flavidovirens]
MLKDVLDRAVKAAQSIEQSPEECAEYGDARTKARDFRNRTAVEAESLRNAVSEFTSGATAVLDPASRKKEPDDSDFARLGQQGGEQQKTAQTCLGQVQEARNGFSGEVNRLSTKHSEVAKRVTELEGEIAKKRKSLRELESGAIMLPGKSINTAGIKAAAFRTISALEEELKGKQVVVARLERCRTVYAPIIENLSGLAGTLQNMSNILGSISNNLAAAQKLGSRDMSGTRINKMLREVQDLKKLTG